MKLVLSALAIFALATAAVAAPQPVQIVALGDSLTAGYGLPPGADFASRLEAALRQKGRDVKVSNAGVSGDTSAQGLDRLDWSVPEGTDLVILELGANDGLRGIAPELMRQSLSAILDRLAERRIAVLLAGMEAPPNMGADYTQRFRAVFRDLAESRKLSFYPFFLAGVAGDAKLNQADGMHPTAAGVEIIVSRILPSVEAVIDSLR